MQFCIYYIPFVFMKIIFFITFCHSGSYVIYLSRTQSVYFKSSLPPPPPLIPKVLVISTHSSKTAQLFEPDDCNPHTHDKLSENTGRCMNGSDALTDVGMTQDNFILLGGL